MVITDRYLDDLNVGETWHGEPFEMTETDIVRFASEYDPQPMHVDNGAAAQGRFGGIIASGWHVASRVMREYVDTSPFGATPMLGLRIDELCWLHPVRPGDHLTVSREIKAITRSKSKPDRGTVKTATTVVNQNGAVVMTFLNLIQMGVRPRTGA